MVTVTLKVDTMRYRIDRHDAVVELDEQWAVFARSNQAPQLGPPQILGQPIWRFIGGAEMQLLYALMLTRARQTQAVLVLPFRCDAPDERRYMELQLSAGPDQAVDFVSRCLRTERREPVPLLVGAVGKEIKTLLTMCSWCKRIRTAERVWLEVEEASHALGLHREGALPRIVHGICGSCTKFMIHAK